MNNLTITSDKRYYQPVELEKEVEVCVFLDLSFIEIFVNDQGYLVSRKYPTREDNLGVGFFTESDVSISSLDIWEMKSIWRKE